MKHNSKTRVGWYVIDDMTYLGSSFGFNLKGAEKRRVMLGSLSLAVNEAAGSQ